MRWFRFYDEALDDPKVQRLAPNLFKTWVNLLCIASKSDGKLPSDDDLAFKLRISVQDAAQQMQDLILAELIDIGPKGERFPHNWQSRQYASDSSAERMRKHRKNKKENKGDVTGDGTVTVQTQTREDTETDNKLQLSNSNAARARDGKSELGFNLNSKSGLGKRDGMETLLRQAEGFGLDVDELVEITNRNNPKKREGYFSTLCVNRLKDKLPGLAEQIIRDALNGKHEQSKTVCALLVGAAP